MTTATYMTPSKVAATGFRALVDKLGAGGAIEFVHQFEQGDGDYTRERKHILRDFRLEDLGPSRRVKVQIRKR
jgi:hypothetical protein